MVDKVIDAELAGGEFARQESRFRDWIGTDPRSGRASRFPAEPGRYHLYISLACPWCHRVAILRELAGLQQALAISYLAPFRDERGWAFTGERFEDGPGGEYVDALHGWELMSEAYRISDPSFAGRITVPVLWDTETGQIVNNESAEIIRMMYRADSLGGLGAAAGAVTRGAAPPRSTRSTSASTTRSTTVSTGPASRAGRTHTSTPSPSCSRASSGSRSCSASAATCWAIGSPRPTGGCSRRSPASTRSTTCTSAATTGGWSTTRACGATRASSTSCPASRRRSRWIRSSATTTPPTTS